MIMDGCSFLTFMFKIIQTIKEYDMWLYFCLAIHIIFSSIFIYVFDQKKISIFTYLIFTMGLFCFFSMFRSVYVGNDTGVYVNLFYKISDSSDLSMYSWRYDVGYLCLNKILSFISDNHQILLIVTSLYIYLVMGWFIYKHSKMVWLSVFLFFTLGYFDLSMSGIRQMLAIMTILISYQFIVEKKPVRFILTVIIASLFHNTAIIFLVAYPLSRYKLNKELIFMFIIVSLLMFVLFRPFLKIVIAIFPRYSYYLGGSYIDDKARLGVVVELLIIITVLVTCELFNKVFIGSKKIGITSKNNYMTLKNDQDEIQSVFLLVACSIMFLALRANIFNRVGKYFSFFLILYLPNSIYKISNKNLKIFVIICVISLFFSYSTAIQIFRPEWQSSYPYTFFWNVL